MKFDCGPTARERFEASIQWRSWFAWPPVRIDGTRECRWLERVERRASYDYVGTYYSYRLPPPPEA